MIPVHEEPLEVQRWFGKTVERCEFCRLPTRYWDATKQHSVCQQCAQSHSIDELSAAKESPQLCPCGYPAPCNRTVPVGFCRAAKEQG